MKKLEIKHLAPYLPYKLIMKNCYFKKYNGYILSIPTFEASVSRSDLKPILYPLDYLTKEITHNGETFVPIECLEDKYYTLNYRMQCLRLLDEDGHNWINQTDYMLVQQLIEWRFDVFNLINDGLAIPVTEEFNPYQ